MSTRLASIDPSRQVTFTADCLTLVVDSSPLDAQLVGELARLIAARDRPRMPVSDKGSEFSSNATPSRTIP